MTKVHEDPAANAGTWVLALARADAQLTCFLSDGHGLFVHALGRWPGAAGADVALPARLGAAIADGMPSALCLQLDAELDAWPWEIDVQRCHGKASVMRYLSAPPQKAVGEAAQRLGSACRDDPMWLHGALDVCAAAAWQAQQQGLPMLAVSDAASPAQARAFRVALQTRWAVGGALSAAALETAAECALARAHWRLYGDALYAEAVDAGEQRRHITTVSIDLLDSTGLLHRWGAERYAETHAAFHRLCRRIVDAHGGRLDDPQGDDGLMAYFGLSQGQAHTASQAVRAAWLLAQAVAELGFTARLGVATGRLAVSQAQPFGLEVHLAARLQRAAPAHGILVSEATQRLLDADVVCEPVPDLVGLAGFDTAQKAYGVVQVHGPGAAPRGFQGPFVGRQAELLALNRVWDRACALRRVQYQCVLGEAGIGKSRLLYEFERQLRGKHPAAALLRLAGHAETQSTAFAALGLAWPGPAMPLLGSLAQRSPPPADVVPAHERQRERAMLIDALVAEFTARAQLAPLCCIFDDAHWLDPTTLELLDRLRALTAEVPMLLIVSLRDGLHVQVQGQQDAQAMTLRSLDAAESLHLIGALSSAVPMSAELQQSIAGRAGGVPLYLEETVRMLARRDADARASVQGIPDTLEDVLMARLDALGPARALAQLAAVLGAEFPSSLWQAVLNAPEDWIRRAQGPGALQRLLTSGLLIAPELGRERYRFKHALLRDAAYESLWLRDRKRLHACVAQVLERSGPDAFGGLALRAHHLAAAGATQAAIAAWTQAARQAAADAADREALALSQHALVLLAGLPDTQDHRQQALQLHLLQAARYMALDGYGAASVESAYLRAAALCSDSQDTGMRTRVELGLEACYAMRGDLARARALAEAAVAQTPWDDNLRLALQARWAWVNVVFHQGELLPALDMAAQCLERYHPSLHRPSAVQDPAVMCLCYSAWGLFERGCAGQARLHVHRLLALTGALNHAFSLAVAHGFAASVALFCGDHALGLQHADESVRLCTASAFQAWLAHAQIMRGRLRAALGSPVAGLADMEQGYALWTATGARITCATYLAMQAEVCLQLGEPQQALQKLAQAQEIAQRHGEHYHAAELQRLQGWAFWQAQGGAADAETAQALLARALDTARRQGKLGFALRSATALARTWAVQQQPGRAAALLREALDAVPDHHDTADYRAALADWKACVAAAT